MAKCMNCMPIKVSPTSYAPFTVLCNLCTVLHNLLWALLETLGLGTLQRPVTIQYVVSVQPCTRRARTRAGR